jgi:CheY-like chemotaxis protein
VNNPVNQDRYKPLILVVDDEWLNRELMEAVLESAGYDAALAGNKERALKIAREQQPDLILVDVRLHYDTEGYDLCRTLKTDPITAHLPVAMLSAMDSEADQYRAMQVGADDFISRMLETPLMLDKIAQLLQK